MLLTLPMVQEQQVQPVTLLLLQPRGMGATDLTPAAGTTFPLTVIARMARLLDQQNVDKQGRWLVVDPVFMEVLKDEDSRLFNQDFGQSGGIREW